MVFVGLISYPLYLWHWPLLSFLEIVQPPGSMLLYKVGAAAASVILATATYLFLERRIRLPPFVRARNIVLASAGCALLGIVVAYESGFAAARGPWGIAQLPARFEPAHMNTSECLKRFSSLFRPEVLHGRDFCTLGSATGHVTGETVRVLGDSHAGRLFVGLREADRTRSYENFGRGSCVPLAGFDASWGDTGEPLDCQQTTANLLKDAAEMKHGTVILHGFFVRAYYGGFILTGSGDAAAQVRTTLTMLARDGLRVVFVLDVPELPFEPSSCIARPALRSQVRTPCSFPRADWDKESAAINRDIRAVAADFPNVTVFDPATVLCNRYDCQAVRDGNLLYTDSHHLSLAGSTLVGGELKKLLDGQPDREAVNWINSGSTASPQVLGRLGPAFSPTERFATASALPELGLSWSRHPNSWQHRRQRRTFSRRCRYRPKPRSCQRSRRRGCIVRPGVLERRRA